MFSPPKSTNSATAKEVSCYRHQDICVVLWNRHLEWYTIGSSITFLAEFQTKGFEYYALQVVDNTSYILFGGQTLSDSSPIIMRINRLALANYALATLGQVSGIRGPVSNLHLISFTRWIVAAEKETRRITISDITNMSLTDQVQSLSNEARTLPKFIRGVEHYINDTIFAVASDRIQLIKTEGLATLAESPVISNQVLLGMQTWD